MEKKINIVWFVILFVGMVARIFGDGGTVSYYEGDILVESAGDTFYLDFGDPLNAGDVVVLQDDDMVEIEYLGKDITLGNAGRYILTEIFEAAQKRTEMDIFSALEHKMALMARYKKEQSAVLGVRGAQFGNVVEEGSPLDILLETAEASIKEGYYDAGLAILDEAFDYVYDEQERWLLFYIAGVYEMDGQSIRALRTLEDIEPEYEDTFYPEYAALFSRLLYETYAFNQVIDFVDNIEYDFTNQELHGQILVLKALAMGETRDYNGMEKSLQDVISRYPESEIGKKAESLLESFQ